MKTPPVKVKEREVNLRIKDFEEVVEGFSEKEAQQEAKRCLQCKDPKCILGCPVGIDIKKFIYQITKEDYAGAYFTIREKNDFPSICGRVCPAEYQCRKSCVLTKKDLPFASEESIQIHFLERFIGDYGIKNNLWQRLKYKKPNTKDQKKVAIVGSGPAGLCCAGELARQGIKVVVFEGLHQVGGVLRYGIPEFRLPRKVLDKEIEIVEKLGVEIKTNVIVGRTILLEELFEQGFLAIFLGLGAGTPSFLGIKGENLCNIYSANEFLTRVNLMGGSYFPKYHTPINIGKHIVVIGGGNTAMDAARVALRLQYINGFNPDVTVAYRRTENEMPARRLEIEHAKEEGIKFEFLIKPEEFLGDTYGFVKKIRFSRCKLGVPDASGRPRPEVIPESSFEMDADLVIIAIGLNANRILTSVTSDLKTDKYGNIIVESQTMQTSIKGVFAGGDIVGGEGTVIEAMEMSKKASKAIIEYLNNL